MSSQFQNCRMYANKYPEVDDVVMVEVRCLRSRLSLPRRWTRPRGGSQSHVSATWNTVLIGTARRWQLS